MNRQMDLVRAIISRLELSQNDFGSTPAIPGYDRSEVGYHVHLMGQAGLLVVFEVANHSGGPPFAVPTDLTSRGRGFAEAARDDAVWATLKGMFKGTGPFSVEVAAFWAGKIAAERSELARPGCPTVLGGSGV